MDPFDILFLMYIYGTESFVYKDEIYYCLECVWAD